MQSLADLFGVSVDYLLGRTDFHNFEEVIQYAEERGVKLLTKEGKPITKENYKSVPLVRRFLHTQLQDRMKNPDKAKEPGAFYDEFLFDNLTEEQFQYLLNKEEKEIIAAFPSNDNPMKDLPEPALKELEHYTEYLYQKWKGWKPGDPPR